MHGAHTTSPTPAQQVTPQPFGRDWSKRDWIGLWILCASTALAPWIATVLEIIGLSRWGFPGLKGWDFLIFGILIMLVPALLGAGLLFAIYPTRRHIATVLFCTGLLTILSWMTAAELTSALRHSAFESLAERSMPVVHAIQAYEKDHGEPPQKLEILVPRYLSEVPGTGLGMYPNYYYRLGSVENNYRWILRVNASRGILSWDTFIYLPGEQYPEEGFGGRIERVGRWAYVHE